MSAVSLQWGAVVPRCLPQYREQWSGEVGHREGGGMKTSGAINREFKTMDSSTGIVSTPNILYSADWPTRTGENREEILQSCNQSLSLCRCALCTSYLVEYISETFHYTILQDRKRCIKLAGAVLGICRGYAIECVLCVAWRCSQPRL